MAIDHLTKQQAEELSGLPLDGRRKYFIWNGEVCVNENRTVGCSGCLPDDEYSDARIGSGCSECGYTGKRRTSYPLPVKYIDWRG